MFVIHLLFKSLSKNKKASTYSLNKRGCLFYWLLRQAQPRENYQANLMCNNNTTSLPQSLSFASCHLDITISTLIAVLSVIAVLENLLVLTAIWKKNFSRTSFLIIFSGLALTDLCTGLIAQPVYITSTIVYLDVLVQELSTWRNLEPWTQSTVVSPYPLYPSRFFGGIHV